MPRIRYQCPKCGEMGSPNTVTRRDRKGRILRKESYCLHTVEGKTASGHEKTRRCKLGVVQSAEELGLDFLSQRPLE